MDTNRNATSALPLCATPDPLIHIGSLEILGTNLKPLLAQPAWDGGVDCPIVKTLNLHFEEKP